MNRLESMEQVTRRSLDWLACFVVAALVTLSLIYIRSTDIVGPNFEIGTKWLWQAVWAALGTALLLSARSIDYRLLGPA
ncbi:MAG: hypothetical protein HN976_06860, partial [Lentisphaerae bacterium]|nr:hypothetical protein [Lentisphaerota bacterium]